MNFQDYIDFANEIHTCYLATADGDQPRVRTMGMCFADETGFYFRTESVKAVCKQLQNNRKVEAIFPPARSGPGGGKLMRVSGEVEFVDDMAIRTRIFNDMRRGKVITKPEDPLLAVFRIAKGEAYFWTMADNMKESEIERVKFGD